ncbi:CO dehydrogenase/acetyl-CoA synthase delta subunit, TIM barrel [Desulfovibrio sp. X2]|nr:CO dehydrogenase/acetyl-CoA synthase delta subunit, TIM barrel [Desulfovibrio sp. X2]
MRAWPFVEGWIETPAGPVPRVRSAWRGRDRLGALAVRLGIGRDSYRIAPGLYALGAATPESPVLVTSNYKLTFDTLRRALPGRACWILVVETYGINVWCAAGKRTFSTEEVADRVRAAKLEQVVSHRRLVLPQLCAPGVAAHRLRRLCGFSGVFGPVRAEDLPAFLDAGMTAGEALREVRFPLAERLAVSFVEIRANRRLTLAVALCCLVLAALGPGGFTVSGTLRAALGGFAVFAAAFAAGVFLVPALLARIPVRAFAAKGLVAGGAVGLALASVLAHGLPDGLAAVCAAMAFASWFAMNYTGSTPFTSLSGVDREMRRYMPLQAGLLLAAVLLWLVPCWFSIGSGGA